MKGTGLAIAGIGINTFITLILLASGEYPTELGVVMLAFVAVSVFGLVLIASGKSRLGAGLVIAGSIPFVPIGLIGAIGGRKVLDQAKEERFHAERGR